MDEGKSDNFSRLSFFRMWFTDFPKILHLYLKALLQFETQTKFANNGIRKEVKLFFENNFSLFQGFVSKNVCFTYFYGAKKEFLVFQALKNGLRNLIFTFEAYKKNTGKMSTCITFFWHEQSV